MCVDGGYPVKGLVEEGLKSFPSVGQAQHSQQGLSFLLHLYQQMEEAHLHYGPHHQGKEADCGGHHQEESWGVETCHHLWHQDEGLHNLGLMAECGGQEEKETWSVGMEE